MLTYFRLFLLQQESFYGLFGEFQYKSDLSTSGILVNYVLYSIYLRKCGALYLMGVVNTQIFFPIDHDLIDRGYMQCLTQSMSVYPMHTR